jgi:hypothetical protein
MGTDIVRPSERQLRKRAVQIAAMDRAAHDQVVASPRVVGAAVRAAMKCAAEVGKRE